VSDSLDVALFGAEPPRDDGLALLENDAMRARRRPVAIAQMWAWEAAVGAIVAWPVATVVRAAYGGHPQGDAPLWTPGALDLAQLGLYTAPARAGLIMQTIALLAIGAVVGILPTSALIASLAFVRRDRRPPPLRTVLVRGIDAFPSMFVLLVAAVCFQLLVGLVAIVVGQALSSGLVEKMGEARSDQIGALATLLILGLALVIGVAHDLARAALMRYRVGVLRAAELASNTLRRSPASLVWSWAWRAIAAWVPVLMGSLVADRLGGRGGAALFALFLVHQLVIASRVALRASWLAKGLRAVDHAHRVIRAEDA
jgi:uncharacterized membrane protein (GlpM family)